MTKNSQFEWSRMKARVSNRLARHFGLAPFHLAGTGAMVSFTFDDVAESAASIGAPMIERYGARGTYYVSGSLLDRWSGHWNGAAADDVVGLHSRGHEIACHTFSHRRVVDLDAASMSEEIELNRRYFADLDPSIRLENFAYPFGLASLSRKTQLATTFHSSRGILPGINAGIIDLHFLRAVPLVNVHIDEQGIDQVFDQAKAVGGWLIFYGHDVADNPSPYGCTPGLMRHALETAARRQTPVVTVAEALRRATAQHPEATVAKSAAM